MRNKFFASLILGLLSLSTVAVAQTAKTSTTASPAPKKGVTFSAAPIAQATGQTGQGINNAIAFNWQYTVNAPACAATLTNCQSGFTLTDTTAGVVVANPSVLAPSLLSYTYTPSAGLYFGTHVFSLVANGYDGNGLPLTSVAATVSVTNGITSLNGPTGLTGVVQ